MTGRTEPAASPDPVPPASGTSTRRSALTIGFYALVLALLVWFLLRLDLGALARIEIGWGFLAAGLVVGLGQRMLLPLVWVLIVRNLGVTIRNYAAYNFVYAKAWLGRYIPGKVAMVAARVYFANELGATRSVMVVSSLAEIGAQLLVGGAVGLAGVASLARSSPVLEPYRPIALGMLALLALFLIPPVFNATMRLLFRIARRPVDGCPRVGGRTLAWAIGGFLVVSLGTGALALLVAAAVEPAALDHAVFVWGAYSLAIALGMAFVLAPSGLGAREAVQLPLLTLIVSPEAALAIVVLSRIAEVVVDLLFYATALFWTRFPRR